MLAQTLALALSYVGPLNTELGLQFARVPKGFVLDHTRSQIGSGQASFESARAAFHAWKMFDLGWVQVLNPQARIAVGEIIAVQAKALGLWSVNLSRILYVIDEPLCFGYGYGTTPMHIERGEERFLLEFDPTTGSVYYDLLAVSQPANFLARLAYPFTRMCQKQFARESHRRMALGLCMHQRND